jgi:hypothetical protein
LQLQPGASPSGGAGAYQITVDQTGGTVNVKAGVRKEAYTTAGRSTLGTAGADEVDNGGLIGVEGDEVKGVDIPVEQTKLTIMFRHPQGKLTKSYIDAIGRIVGFPNSDTFVGYQPGEVMYKGGQFSETNTEATATYNFDISYNRTNFVIGGITLALKYGWDIMSFTYKDTNYVNGAGKTLPVKNIKCIEIIRPAGREWVAYQSAFGWGG